jgi:hypothetical protein
VISFHNGDDYQRDGDVRVGTGKMITNNSSKKVGVFNQTMGHNRGRDARTTDIGMPVDDRMSEYMNYTGRGKRKNVPTMPDTSPKLWTITTKKFGNFKNFLKNYIERCTVPDEQLIFSRVKTIVMIMTSRLKDEIPFDGDDDIDHLNDEAKDFLPDEERTKTSGHRNENFHKGADSVDFSYNGDARLESNGAVTAYGAQI